MPGEKPEKHPSGAKARIDIAGLMYGLKPVPFTEASVSATCEAARFQSSQFPAAGEAAPFRSNDNRSIELTATAREIH
jgi:hypothetical protein